VSDAKALHEEGALQALVSELKARGRDARITGRPDIEGHHILTTDATLEVDGREWAVDHCLVSREPDLPPAMAQAERTLSSRLQAIAEAHKCGLAVSYLPQAKSGRSRREIEDYCNEVTETAETAAKSGQMSAGSDGFITVQVYPADPPEAVLIPFTDTTGNPFLGTQLEAGLTRPLTKKLTGQLKNAKDAGWPVALLLDQIPRPGSANKTIWLASAYTIAQVVQRLLNQHPGIVDQVWLRPAEKAPIYVAPQVHLLIA
jgi:hypothetical protein